MTDAIHFQVGGSASQVCSDSGVLVPGLSISTSPCPYSNVSGVNPVVTLTVASGTPSQSVSLEVSSSLYSTIVTYSLNIVGQAPTASSASPNFGTALGGALVTLTGNFFVSGATVTFGGSSATSVTVVNSTTITCLTPAHAVGTVSLVITNPDTQAVTLTNGYIYFAGGGLGTMGCGA